MTMKKGMLIFLAALMALMPVTVSAAVRGFVVVGPAPVWYSPFWAGYWGPAWVGPYYAYPHSGVVKLDTKLKDGQVFIDGAYAGTTQENKTMHLRPGSYNIEVRHDGETTLNERVYVAAGKTIHLKVEG